MLASMTAFTRTVKDHLTWEIRSVNHRNLEVNVRLPDSLAILESTCRQLIRNHVKRGKLDCTLRIDRDQLRASGTVDEDAVSQLKEDLDAVQKRLGVNGTINLIDVIKWPGILESDPTETLDEVEVVRLFDLALQDLTAIRHREGEGIQRLFKAKVEEIESVLVEISRYAQEQSQWVRSKLEQRIEKLDIQVDPDRLAVEVALLAQRADVNEELDRLQLHLGEFKSCLDGSESQGRRLVFLVQEIGREANTLANKIVVPDCIHLTVDLKVMVDQIREQVQNIE